MFALHPKVFLYFFFVALPWLNPFAPGPSAAMASWLVTLICIGASQWLVLEGKAAKNISLLPHFSRALALLWLGISVASVLIALCQYLRIEHWFAPWISQSAEGTAYANLRQRNQFATLCGMGLLALLSLRQSAACGLATRGSPKLACTFQKNTFKNYWHAAWPWLAVTALAIGNGLSSSRTGAMQWLLIAALVWVWRGILQRRVWLLGYGALGIYALVVLAMPWFAQAVGNSSTGLWGRAQEGAGQGIAGNSRLWLYSNVLELIAQKPWLGWGWRELAYAHYSTHFDTRFTELLDNAHNLPLHLAVELGVPFALLFCGAVLWWIVRNAPWRETDPARQLAWGVLMLIGVHSMVEYPLWYGPFLMTLGLCVGLLQSTRSSPKGVCHSTTNTNAAESVVFNSNQVAKSVANFQSNRSLAQSNKAQAAIKLVAIALLTFTAYAAFDYHRISQIYLPIEERSAMYSGDALAYAQKSWLFQKQARFAELVITPVTRDSAPRVLALALDMIHFSPEPRVIEALIESATMLQFNETAMFHLARYKEVYPKDYAAWSALKSTPSTR
jgi:Virulence factor membrane-bound polymerase, C-terminal/O-Antigen ligase/Protein glycosylation ligase